jgi:hypothetical protein
MLGQRNDKQHEFHSAVADENFGAASLEEESLSISVNHGRSVEAVGANSIVVVNNHFCTSYRLNERH